MQPLSQAVLLEAFPPHERGKAMGFWGLGIVVAPILGPVLGGWLTDTYSWRWVFYINLPVGLASLVMTYLYIFDPPYLRPRDHAASTTGASACWRCGSARCNWRSISASSATGSARRSSPRWWSCPGLGLVAFLVREWVAKEPVIDLRVFKIRSYATGVFLMTTLGFVLYGSLVLLPIMLQTLLGYPSLQAGIAMAPRGMGSLIGMPVVGLIIGRVDARKLVALGLTVGAGTLWWLGQLNLDAGYWDVFFPQFVQGIGLSLIFVPLTTISMDPIPRERMGNATSLFNLMRNLGGSIGIAVTGTLLQRKTHAYGQVLSEHVDAYSETSRQDLRDAAPGLHRRRHRSGHGDAEDLRRAAGHGHAPGDDGLVRRTSSGCSGLMFLMPAAAGAADAPAQGRGRGPGARQLRLAAALKSAYDVSLRTRRPACPRRPSRATGSRS